MFSFRLFLCLSSMLLDRVADDAFVGGAVFGGGLRHYFGRKRFKRLLPVQDALLPRSEYRDRRDRVNGDRFHHSR